MVRATFGVRGRVRRATSEESSGRIWTAALGARGARESGSEDGRGEGEIEGERTREKREGGRAEGREKVHFSSFLPVLSLFGSLSISLSPPEIDRERNTDRTRERERTRQEQRRKRELGRHMSSSCSAPLFQRNSDCSPSTANKHVSKSRVRFFIAPTQLSNQTLGSEQASERAKEGGCSVDAKESRGMMESSRGEERARSGGERRRKC